MLISIGLYVGDANIISENLNIFRCCIRMCTGGIIFSLVNVVLKIFYNNSDQLLYVLCSIGDEHIILFHCHAVLLAALIISLRDKRNNNTATHVLNNPLNNQQWENIIV